MHLHTMESSSMAEFHILTIESRSSDRTLIERVNFRKIDRKLIITSILSAPFLSCKPNRVHTEFSITIAQFVSGYVDLTTIVTLQFQ